MNEAWQRVARSTLQGIEALHGSPSVKKDGPGRIWHERGKCGKRVKKKLSVTLFFVH